MLVHVIGVDRDAGVDSSAAGGADDVLGFEVILERLVLAREHGQDGRHCNAKFLAQCPGGVLARPLGVELADLGHVRAVELRLGH